MLVGRSQLAREVREPGVCTGGAVIAHCRRSSLGAVVGGAETVVRALLDAVGPAGTLVAYTGWEDAPPDELEGLPPDDRALILAEQPPYDPKVARARREHGRLAEALHTRPGAVHSGHPEAGVTVVGRDAEAIALPHPFDDAYGAGTPYARIVEREGQVVLLGAPLHRDARPPRGGGRTGGRQAAGRVAMPCHGRRPAGMADAPRCRPGAGALGYERLTGGEDYLEYFVRRALADGAGRGGPLGVGSGHVLEARPLVGTTVALVESAFSGREPA